MPGAKAGSGASECVSVSVCVCDSTTCLRLSGHDSAELLILLHGGWCVMVARLVRWYLSSQAWLLQLIKARHTLPAKKIWGNWMALLKMH